MKDRTYKYIRNQIEDSIELRRQFNFDEKYKTYCSYYRGDFGRQFNVVYNLYYTIFRSMVANLYFQDPKILVTSNDPRDNALCQILEIESNDWLTEQTKMKLKMRRIILDTCLAGYGIMEVGSGGKFGRSKDTLMYQLKRDYGDVLPIQLDKVGDEYHDPDNEYIWANRVSPTDFFFPIESLGDLNECRFVCKRYFRLAEHVRKDRRYIGAMKAAFNSFQFGDAIGINGNDDAGEKPIKIMSNIELVALYDYYDYQSGKIYTIAAGHEAIIKREDMVTDGYPFAKLQWTEDPDYAITQSDARVLEDKQWDLNVQESQQANLRNTFKMLLFLKQENFKKKETEKIFNAETSRDIIWCDGNPGESVATAKYSIPPDIYSSQVNLEKKARNEIGFTANQAGTSNSARTSAREVAEIAKAGAQRTNERKSMVGDTVQDSVKLFFQFAQEYWRSERTIYVPDRNMDVTFTNDDLFPRGKLKYQVHIYDDPDKDFETKRMYALQALNLGVKIGMPPAEAMKIMVGVFPEVPELAQVAEQLRTAGAEPTQNEGV